MKLLILLASLSLANAYWLMGMEDFIATERMDPIVSPGKVASHVHSIMGGSNFDFELTTAKLRQSECTSTPIPQDKSSYWFPHLYFQWENGSFSSLNGGAVIYYLFSDTPGTTTAFPDDFRMLSGDPTLRSYNASSFAQQAVTFLCLDFNGVSTRWNYIPTQACPSGVRAQINFPSCWDGKNVDSPDHKSHVAFLSTGPDSGSCSDPNFPVTLPRIFMEVYWSTSDFEPFRAQAMNSTQPYVYSYGDPVGFGYHADFFNGWESGVLQKAVDNCHCNEYGDPTCCVQQGIFDMNQGQTCRITNAVDEQTTGTLSTLPGNNPVVGQGPPAPIRPDPVTPPILAPVYAYTGASATASGTIVSAAQTASATSSASVAGSAPTTVSTASASSSTATHSSSSSTTSTHSSAVQTASASSASVAGSAPTTVSTALASSSATSTHSSATSSGSSVAPAHPTTTSSSSSNSGTTTGSGSGVVPPASGNGSSTGPSEAKSQSGTCDHRRRELNHHHHRELNHHQHHSRSLRRVRRSHSSLI